MKKFFGNKSMKLIAVAALLLAAAIPSFSQATGTLLLQGTVPGILQISVASQTGAITMPLAVTQTNLLVANVTELSNIKAGYTVTLTSLNAGSGTAFFLKGATSGNTDTLAYTLQYNATAVTLVAGSATITSATVKTVAGGVVKPLTISYTGSSGINTDTYSDTLTFTIITK